ncbi:phage capsid protein [Martelella mangrovi]|uniref:Capsid Gp10A/Gp10B-like domain-containing protein n=1 Tax=Martelella mangrovi TaxID=1397477 RepID=A0ABV2IDY0_9HYPH
MADANATPSRLGIKNGTGADDALFLDVFSGEVLTAHDEVNVMADRHYVRTITSGKSASFPATWKIDAHYHVPGQFIGGQETVQSERVITIDDLLISDVFIPNIDEAKNHYDARSIFTRKAGQALANEWDRNVLKTLILTARESGTVEGSPGGSRLDAGADILTNANSALVNSLYEAAVVLDEKDVPEHDRYAVIKPAQYYKLVLDPKAINRDFTAGNGDIRTGKVFDIAGINIVKSNHVPTKNLSAPSGAAGPRPMAKYAGDFSNTVGAVATPDAVGTVKLMDLAVEGEYQINRQGTLIVAKYAMGHGGLRPECIVELSSATGA